MRVYFLKSVCKKCPFFVFKNCFYKTAFYQQIPKSSSKFKLVHKCMYYRQIFSKGQKVFVDLHHRMIMPDGKRKYILAYENVPGVIKGMRGNKYIVELFEAFFLFRNKRFVSQKDPVRLYTECSKAAKDIKPLVESKEGFKNMQHYRIEAEDIGMVLS